jgi:hypothetical protein
MAQLAQATSSGHRPVEPVQPYRSSDDGSASRKFRRHRNQRHV